MKRERRKFTNDFKADVALEASKEKLTIVELAQKFKISPVQIKVWKKEFLENKANVFNGVSNKTRREEEDQSRQEQELFEQIGRLKMENEWLKKKVL